MAVTRRAFLGSLGIGAAALALGGISQPASASAKAVPAALDTTLRAGDVFTIAGRQSLNPLTRKATGHLQRFVVTTTVPAGDRLKSDDIWPKPMVSGAYANIDGLPVGEIVDARELTRLSWGDVVPCKVTWADA